MWRALACSPSSWPPWRSSPTWRPHAIAGAELVPPRASSSSAAPGGASAGACSCASSSWPSWTSARPVCARSPAPSSCSCASSSATWRSSPDVEALSAAVAADLDATLRRPPSRTAHPAPAYTAAGPAVPRAPWRPSTPETDPRRSAARPFAGPRDPETTLTFPSPAHAASAPTIATAPQAAHSLRRVATIPGTTRRCQAGCAEYIGARSADKDPHVREVRCSATFASVALLRLGLPLASQSLTARSPRRGSPALSQRASPAPRDRSVESTLRLRWRVAPSSRERPPKRGRHARGQHHDSTLGSAAKSDTSSTRSRRVVMLDDRPPRPVEYLVRSDHIHR